MKDQLRALLSSGAATQLFELAASLRGAPLPPPAHLLIPAACPPVDGVDWFLVSDGPQQVWLRAALVSDWLIRWARTQPDLTRWLVHHAIGELRADLDHRQIRLVDHPGLNHRLMKGTARLLRLHIPDAEQRRYVDLVSEDRADWQRASPEHRRAVMDLTIDWIVHRVAGGSADEQPGALG
ncbi:MAG: hypothetical protein AAFV53_42795 [Myxococcota bacterium]